MSAMNPTHLQQFSLSGKLAIVTGGARGLGLEMVRGLAAAGATVYLHGRDLTQMTDAIRALGAQAGDIRPLRSVAHAGVVDEDVDDAVLREQCIDRTGDS